MATIAAIVGAAATTASSAYGIAKSESAKGKAGGGAQPQSLNAASEFANWLFGPNVSQSNNSSQNRAAQWQWSMLDTKYRNSPFAGARQSISDYLNDPTLTQQRETARAMSEQAPGALGTAMDEFRNVVFPSINELATTGSPTDIDALVAKRKADYERDIIPQLREEFAGQTGTYSSDFLNSLLREGSRLETDIGSLDYAAQEAAKGRRLSATPLAGNLATVYAGLPSASATDYIAATNAANEAFSPGRRAIDILGALSGVASRGQYIQPGFNPAGSGTAQNLSALAGSIPDLAGAGADVFNQFNTPSGGADTGVYNNAVSGQNLTGYASSPFYQPDLSTRLGWGTTSK